MLDQNTLRLIEQHLPKLHKDCWSQIAADLSTAISAAHGSKRDDFQRLLDQHQASRHRPETSRAALIEQAEANEKARGTNGR